MLHTLLSARCAVYFRQAQAQSKAGYCYQGSFVLWLYCSTCMDHGDPRGQSRAERGIELKGKKSSEEEGVVMSSCGARTGPQAFIPLAHARRKGGRPRSLLPFLYSPPSPPPFSFFILFYASLQHKPLLLMLFILPNIS
jgi:hypothetical protein